MRFTWSLTAQMKKKHTKTKTMDTGMEPTETQKHIMRNIFWQKKPYEGFENKQLPYCRRMMKVLRAMGYVSGPIDSLSRKGLDYCRNNFSDPFDRQFKNIIVRDSAEGAAR